MRRLGETVHAGGWIKTGIIIGDVPASKLSEERRSRLRVVAEAAAAKKKRLGEWAPNIAEDDILAFGAASGERDVQNIDFYLAKVVEAPRVHSGLKLQIGCGKTRWHIKEGEIYVKVRWLKEIRPGVFQDEEHEDT